MTERFMAWNDKQIAALKELVVKGCSSSQIGVVLGCSRNAIIGKAHRLGLIRTKEVPRGNNPWTKEEDDQLVALDKKGVRHALIGLKLGRSISGVSHRAIKLGIARQNKRSQERVPKLVAPDDAPPVVPLCPPLSRSSGLTPFIDSVFGQCKWPCWDGNTPADQRMVCGDAAFEGHPYCGVHCCVAYSTFGQTQRIPYAGRAAA